MQLELFFTVQRKNKIIYIYNEHGNSWRIINERK